jgi:hypothetical protein
MDEVDYLVTLEASGRLEGIILALRMAGFDITNVFPEVGVVVIHGPESNLDQIKDIPGVSTVGRKGSTKSTPPGSVQ